MYYTVALISLTAIVLETTDVTDIPSTVVVHCMEVESHDWAGDSPVI